jgi:hypothetical protein
MAISGGNNGGGNSQESGFGGYSTHQELIDAVVEWLPKLTRLFLSKYQGKYNAWSTLSSLASGAPQVPSSQQNSENIILNSWFLLTEKQRISIVQYALSFRMGGPGCTRRFNRPYSECEQIAVFKGENYCIRYKTGAEGDICDQASAPSICRRVVSTWKGYTSCESLNDEEADRFFSWLSAKFINQSENIGASSLTDLYLSGIPKKKKK